MKISPKRILRDRGTQIRSSIDEKVVDEYAELMKSGTSFPPPAVVYDGDGYILVDGFHRVLAAIKADIPKIEVSVESGDARTAILYAVGANSTHGLKRTNEDKRRAVMVLLNDQEWCQWSNEAIAKRCGVAPNTVANHRPQSANCGLTEIKTVNKYGQETTRKAHNSRAATAVAEVESDDEQHAKIDQWNEERAEFARQQQASVGRQIAAKYDYRNDKSGRAVAAAALGLDVSSEDQEFRVMVAIAKHDMGDLADVLRIAAEVAEHRGMVSQDYIAEVLRPIVERDMEEIEQRRGKAGS